MPGCHGLAKFHCIGNLCLIVRCFVSGRCLLEIGITNTACFRSPRQVSSFVILQQGEGNSLQTWELAKRFEKVTWFFVSLIFLKPRGLLAFLSTLE